MSSESAAAVGHEHAFRLQCRDCKAEVEVPQLEFREIREAGWALMDFDPTLLAFCGGRRSLALCDPCRRLNFDACGAPDLGPGLYAATLVRSPGAN